MTTFPISSGSKALGATEFSVAANANYASGSPRTTTGRVAFRINMNAMIAGDIIEVRKYAGANGGALVEEQKATVKAGQIFTGVIESAANGWELTVVSLTNTVNITFDVWQDIGDVNIATLAAAAIAAIQAGLATGAALAAVQSDTDDVQTRLPAALVGGRIACDVGSWLGTVAQTPTVAGVPRVEELTLQGRLTVARANNMDISISSRASATAVAAVQADTTTLTARLTSLRAALLDNLSFLDSGVSASVGATAAAVWSFAHWPGRTALGALRRLDQLVTGRHAGLVGALWQLFAPDGTVLVQAAQDTSAGTRDASTIVLGD